MPGLTVTEKEFRKGRIAARIAGKVEAIRAEHSALFDRAGRQAHAQALESLGLAASYADRGANQADEAAKVGELLGDEPTRLEGEALAIGAGGEV